MGYSLQDERRTGESKDMDWVRTKGLDESWHYMWEK